MWSSSGIPSTKSAFLCAFASKFLPDGAWPGNSCRMANDATRGVGNSSAQTVGDHAPREWEDPQAKRCGGMERSGSLCGRACRSAEAAALAGVRAALPFSLSGHLWSLHPS